ncbi:MAG: sulfite exporter TauE/SafE family protein [Anaerolineales bacterium]|nr:sulfite exporter TauE/SafE family protein [Anaerolineales bacterium]
MRPAYTLLQAFVLGLAHTLEPCEDKAVVSLFVMWSSRRLREATYLVILYGLGMTIIDTVLGFICAYLGVALLREHGALLKGIAGAITFVFGLLMVIGSERAHLGHHHGETSLERMKAVNLGAPSVFALGLLRGLPPCPVELAVLTWAASVGQVWRGTLMVFVFGLGTTIGLIPLGLVMGGLAGAVKKTRYEAWVPRICGLVMMVLGIWLVLSQ